MFWQSAEPNSERKLLKALDFSRVIIKRAYGSFVVDADGKEYLDFASGQIASLVGHSHPKLVEAISEQSGKAINLNSVFISDSLIEAVSLLSGLAPQELDRYIFLNTGTEANELALKISKAYNKKKCIVAFDRGYYGSSFYTGQLSSSGNKAGLFPQPEGVLNIKAPYCFKCPLNKSYPGCGLACLSEAEKILKAESGDISAFIVEPVLSVGGIIVPPQDYFKRLCGLAHKYDALVIVDEAQTGMGRTGRWFAYQHWDGFNPDIIVLAKGTGGGYPVSIVMTKSRIENVIIKHGFRHISSHMNDPISAAAFSAVVKIIKDENLLEEAVLKGLYFKDKLLKLREEYGGIINDIRGIGLMLGVEISGVNGRSASELTSKINDYCFSSGLILGYSSHNNIFRICPPLTISRKEIDRGAEIIKNALKEITAGSI